jgi:hypothetical protein
MEVKEDLDDSQSVPNFRPHSLSEVTLTSEIEVRNYYLIKFFFSIVSFLMIDILIKTY